MQGPLETRRHFLGQAAAAAVGATFAPGLLRRAVAQPAPPPQVSADLVLVNANAITMDPARPAARAVAIGAGRILAVGASESDVSPWIGHATTIRDLGGRTLLPGFFDSHNHALSTGQNLPNVDLSGAKSVDDVLAALASRIATTPPGDWVISSSRWHETQLAEQRFPTREELDRIAPAHPIMIQRGGHNLVVNSLALRMAGVPDDVANPPGGTYVRDPQTGALVGHLIDAAMTPVRAIVPVADDAALLEAARAVQAQYNQAGITSVIEPGLGAREMGIWRRLRDNGDLSLRLNMMWRLAPGFTDRSLQNALEMLSSGVVSYEPDDPWLRTIALKVGIDGGVEAGYYREPYVHPDDPTAPRGKPLVAPENMAAFCVAAAQQGWQVGTHCVGDAGIDLVLNAYAAADQAAPIVGRRWTLIHMMFAQPDHFAVANRLGAIVTAQQPLMYSLANGFQQYIGPDRARNIEPLRMYLDHSSQPVGGGSDSPVTPYQPLLGIWSSVTRSTDLAGVQGPEWRVGIDEALRMYTIGSAYASFEEDTKGSITPGKFADLVVLANDPRSVDASAIRDLKILQTLVDGRVVYDADEGTGAEVPVVSRATAAHSPACDCA
jgi:predicted amidohydrolase YtcJ